MGLSHAWLGAALNISSMNRVYNDAVSSITAQREAMNVTIARSSSSLATALTARYDSTTAGRDRSRSSPPARVCFPVSKPQGMTGSRSQVHHELRSAIDLRDHRHVLLSQRDDRSGDHVSCAQSLWQRGRNQDVAGANSRLAPACAESTRDSGTSSETRQCRRCGMSSCLAHHETQPPNTPKCSQSPPVVPPTHTADDSSTS